jgi:hypothetical protein
MIILHASVYIHVEAGYCSRQEGKDSKRERSRQAQGIVKAKAAGAYRGRPEDTARNAGIAAMLHSGMSWTAIQAVPGGDRQGLQAGGVDGAAKAAEAIADAMGAKGHRISQEGAPLGPAKQHDA